MKTCLILQPFGVGDIIFLQKVAKVWREKGYKVIWPIVQHYHWVRDYLADDQIEYPLLTNDRQELEPFEFSEEFFFLMKSEHALFRAPVIGLDFVYLSCGPATLKWEEMMTAKYFVSGVDYNGWQDYVKITRNLEKESQLFNILGLNDGEPYTLINENASCTHIDIPYDLGKSIKLQTIPGFSLFDWSTVIEKCSRLITIDTSLCHLAEVVLPKDTPCHLLNRYNPPHFVDLPTIFKLNWQYCITPGELKF